MMPYKHFQNICIFMIKDAVLTFWR